MKILVFSRIFTGCQCVAPYIRGPAVIKEDGIYKIWYCGHNSIAGIYGIGYATSPDGINWTKTYDSDDAGGRISEFGVVYESYLPGFYSDNE